MVVNRILKEFNLLASCARGNERAMCNELLYVLKDDIGDQEAKASKTGIRGLVCAKTSLDPLDAIEKFRTILAERPFEFRYALRIIPIQQVVPTDLEEIKKAANEMAQKIGESQTFRVTVEKRYTSLHSTDIINAAAGDIKATVDLHNPDLILLVEVLGNFTGLSLIAPSDVLGVVKEKMMPS
ncbi:MAG: THUMP domain-containing protein [Candidatus Bathyarchaeota archaeon]|nr:THUMP domain-containing protein [Candidatus Bathyarchaeota archaeon]